MAEIKFTTKGFEKLSSFIKTLTKEIENEVVRATTEYAKELKVRIKTAIISNKYPVGPNNPEYKKWKQETSNVKYDHPLAATGQYAASIGIFKEKKLKSDIIKLRIGPDDKARRGVIPFSGPKGGPAKTELKNKRTIAAILADSPKYRHMVLEADRAEREVVNNSHRAVEQAIKKSIK